MKVPIYREPLQVYAGNPFSVPVYFSTTNAEGEETETDFTGKTLRAQWRTSSDSIRAYDADVIVEGNKVTATWNGSQTASMNSDGVFDFDADGVAIFKGFTYIEEDVTR